MFIDEMIKQGKKDFREEDQEAVREKRFKAVKETTLHQVKNCQAYRQFCKEKDFNPNRDLKTYEDIKKIPYLTTANFKREEGTPRKLLCVPEEEVQVWTKSSGTSGDPSIIGRDRVTLERFLVMINFMLDDLCNLPDFNWFLGFQPRPERKVTIEDEIKEPISHLGYIFNLVNELPLDERTYALKKASAEAKKQGKKFEFDPKKTFGILSSASEKGTGWVAGSIPLMYKALMDYYQKTGNTFDIGEDTILTTAGGWKTFSGEAVAPETFRDDMKKVLNIKKENMTDVYSFTETDCVHAECEYHNMHLLPWQDMIVRDVETLEPVEIGEKGLANVINPIAHSYAGVSVLQDDIVSILMEDNCPCGRKGKIIKIYGRAKGAEAKGCGAQIAEETSQ